MSGWVCDRCGEEHGRRPCKAEELILADCCLCGKRALCATPADFGGFRLHPTQNMIEGPVGPNGGQSDG